MPLTRPERRSDFICLVMKKLAERIVVSEPRSLASSDGIAPRSVVRSGTVPTGSRPLST